MDKSQEPQHDNLLEKIVSILLLFRRHSDKKIVLIPSDPVIEEDLDFTHEVHRLVQFIKDRDTQTQKDTITRVLELAKKNKESIYIERASGNNEYGVEMVRLSALIKELEQS